MIKTRLLVVAIFAALFAPMALAAPTNATPRPKPTQVCVDWNARGATGKYPDLTWGDPGPGTKLDGITATLVKPLTGVDPGVELATIKLDLEEVVPMDISVTYQLSDDADYAAGAVRLFYYEGDPHLGAPDGKDVAMAKTGVLKIEDAHKIGTIGLVYDASNTAAGSVTFAELTIRGRGVYLVLPFTDICPSPTPSMTPSESASPTPTATTSSPAPSLSVSTSPASGTGGGSLPVTGAPMYAVAGVGLALIVAGIVGLVLSRRRREQFEA